jgi:hypothetical protein
MGDPIAINIADNNRVEITCPNCEYKIYIDTHPLYSFTTRDFILECECCNTTFRVIFEKRKHVRKLCNLPAIYIIPEINRTNYINIIDLSPRGLKFARTYNNKLHMNDTIYIRFNLDNVGNDLIECTAIVRGLSNNIVRVQFEEMNANMRRTLGFYFLPVTIKLEMVSSQFPDLRRDTSRHFH